MGSRISRRHFVQAGATLAAASSSGVAWAAQLSGTQTRAAPGSPRGAIVLCDHTTQYGVGETFPEGELNGRWYRRIYSTLFNIQQGLRWLDERADHRFCFELDAFSLEMIAREDASWLRKIRAALDAGQIEFLGGTYGQAESQIFGYESAIRQLTLGQDAHRRHLGTPVTTYLVEEQSFFPQLPQILTQCGYRYASLQFQNSGTPKMPPADLIFWEGCDGTKMLTVPAHAGLTSCAVQRSDHADALSKLVSHHTPLIMQWVEFWVPGLDWGASLEPYRAGVQKLESLGFAQMLLTSYIEWAKRHAQPASIRIPMDDSNYDNNPNQSGWGYENDRIVRGANQCESLLLAAETFAALHTGKLAATVTPGLLKDLWQRLLIAQNHDTLLAASCQAQVDGLRSFQSELAKVQFRDIAGALKKTIGLAHPIELKTPEIVLFNPGACAVEAPVWLELDEVQMPKGPFAIENEHGERQVVQPVLRADSGNVLLSPFVTRMPAAAMQKLSIRALPESDPPSTHDEASILTSPDEGRHWHGRTPELRDIVFEPLHGEWKPGQVYFYDTINPNPSEIQSDLAKARTASFRRLAAGTDLFTWRHDLMRVRDVPEPACSISSVAAAGRGQTTWVEFQHRMVSNIRLVAGKRPLATWHFRLRVPASGLRIVADSPFAEEQRKAKLFYCSRYVRLEWPDRHLLWCPTQNTLFHQFREGNEVIVQCTILDFAFMGATNWGVRFYAAEKLTAAQSMQLAEGLHRCPFTISAGPSPATSPCPTSDHPDVIVTHVFPGSDGTIAVRTLNASDRSVTAGFRSPIRLKSVHRANPEGQSTGEPRPLTANPSGWGHTYRPWEITTFCLRT